MYLSIYLSIDSGINTATTNNTTNTTTNHNNITTATAATTTIIIIIIIILSIEVRESARVVVRGYLRKGSVRCSLDSCLLLSSFFVRSPPLKLPSSDTLNPIS